MLYAYSNKYNYIIGWSAKCGCSLFRKLFFTLHEDELKQRPLLLHHTLDIDFPLPTKINSPNQFVSYKHIVLCRNPYKRAVSMFTNKICGKNNILHSKVPMKTITFRNFIYGLKYLKEKKSPIFYNIHLSPQSHNFKKYEYTTILKLEEFFEKITTVYTDLGLFCLLPQIINFLEEIQSKKKPFNQTIKNNETEFICDKEYPIETTEFPQYEYFYDEELFELVYDLYKDDFENFGYQKYEI